MRLQGAQVKQEMNAGKHIYIYVYVEGCVYVNRCVCGGRCVRPNLSHLQLDFSLVRLKKYSWLHRCT